MSDRNILIASYVETSEPILVVDDEATILEIIEEMLRGQPYIVFQARNLAEAEAILREQEISIVLTDLILRQESGLDVINIAQKIQPTAKVILMTGKPTIQNAVTVLKTGAFDYLVKPFDMDTLRGLLKRTVDQVKLERENIRLNEIMSFYKISEAMTFEINPEKLLKLILETAIREFKADYAAAHFIEHDGSMKMHDSIILDKSLADTFARFSQDLANEVGYKGKPLIINDEDAYARTGSKTIKSALCHPLLTKGKVSGTLIVIRSHNLRKFTTGEMTTLSLFANKAAIEFENARLYRNLEDAYFDTVAVLSNAIETRDRNTGGHTERVWRITYDIAAILGWKTESLKELRMGAMLHDIGKIGVPDAILNKPGPLDPDEFAIMKKHPEIGAAMIEKIVFLNPALPYILYHHERYDGKGYPFGLAGDDIPIQGRLLAVVDTYDAITSDRPYRKGKSSANAIEEILRNSGSQFDPLVVDAFIKVIKPQ